MEILLILEICFVSSEQIERDMKKFEEIQNFSVLQINISNISPIKMKNTSSTKDFNRSSVLLTA